MQKMHTEDTDKTRQVSQAMQATKDMEALQSDSIAYVNGQYCPLAKAYISPLDRGFIFGDGIYEMFQVFNGNICYLEPHIHRLNQSLQLIGMDPPHSLEKWQDILTTLVKKNRANGVKDNDIGNFALYLQITRGVDPIRKQAFPDPVIPTIFATCFPYVPLSKEELSKGYKAHSVKDIRWQYCQIKSTSRLAYILMFQEAKEKGADEGIIIRDGYALEGTSSNFFMVKRGILMTPPKSQGILSGIIRDVILALAKKNQIPHQECDIQEADLDLADELWITSSVRGIYPILEYNGKLVGSGKPGPVWEHMWDLYDEECNRLSLSIPY
jgi:D-alanine transaminase